MTAGLRVFNDSGSRQIDQDYQNYQVSGSGVLQMEGDPNNASYPQPVLLATLNIAGNYPILALQGQAGHGINVEHCLNSDGTWFFRVRCSAADYSQYVYTPYWVFDIGTPVIRSGNAGLRVFRADGSLAYDSSAKPLKVVGVLNPSAPNGGATGRVDDGSYNSSMSIPSGRTYATIQGLNFFRDSTYTDVDIDQTGANPGQRIKGYQSLWGSAASSGSTVSAGANTFVSTTTSVPTSQADTVRQFGGLNFLVVDVTNF